MSLLWMTIKNGILALSNMDPFSAAVLRAAKRSSDEAKVPSKRTKTTAGDCIAIGAEIMNDDHDGWISHVTLSVIMDGRQVETGAWAIKPHATDNKPSSSFDERVAKHYPTWKGYKPPAEFAEWIGERRWCEYYTKQTQQGSLFVHSNGTGLHLMRPKQDWLEAPNAYVQLFDTLHASREEHPTLQILTRDSSNEVFERMSHHVGEYGRDFIKTIQCVDVTQISNDLPGRIQALVDDYVEAVVGRCGNDARQIALINWFLDPAGDYDEYSGRLTTLKEYVEDVEGVLAEVENFSCDCEKEDCACLDEHPSSELNVNISWP